MADIQRQYYKDYYQKQLAATKDNDRITITGFVPEEMIETYFTAADAVIYPYRGYIGASGALNYALAYQKPFWVSTLMSEALENEDFNAALQTVALKKEDIVFNFTHESFIDTIKRLQNKKFLSKLQKLSGRVAEIRSMKNSLPSYHEKIFSENSIGRRAIPSMLLSPSMK